MVKMQSELLSEAKAHKMFRRKTNGCGGKPVEGNLHLSALLQPLEQQSPEFNPELQTLYVLPDMQKCLNAASLKPCQRGFFRVKWRGVIKPGGCKIE